MSDFSKVVDSLEDSVQKLLSQFETEQLKRQHLDHKVSSLELENAQLKEELLGREQAIKSLQTANALLGSNEYRRETKLKINTLMREIDACIASLAD